MAKVSVVIPVKNEEDSLDILLTSIFNQRRKPDEVVIVDANSSDSSKDIVKRYVDKGVPINLLEIGDAYPGTARNAGVKKAKYQIIAFTDAGIKLTPQWLEKLIEPIERNPDVDVVYGSYAPMVDSFFRECASIAYVAPPIYREGRYFRTHYVASSLVKKEVWASVGGFPGFRAGEDMIFVKRICEKGYNIAYSPDALVYWQIQPDLKNTLKRFINYSKHDLIAGRARDWHFGVVRMYLVGILFIILAILHMPFWLILLGILFLARISKLILTKTRSNLKLKYFMPKRFICISCLVFLIDMAVFLGIFLWLKEKKLGRDRRL